MRNFFTISIFVIFMQFVLHATSPKNTKYVTKPTKSKIENDPKLQNINTSRNLRIFPADTVQTFLKRYSKDSLLSLINNRIKLSLKYINDNINYLNDSKILPELVLLNKHFNFNLNMLNEASNIPYTLHSLYNNVYGDTTYLVGILDSIKRNKVNTILDFRKNIDNNFSNMVVATFCDRIYFTDTQYKIELFESYYNLAVKSDLNKKLLMYWKIAEINRKCEDISINSKSYQINLFKELYSSNNLMYDYNETPVVITKINKQDSLKGIYNTNDLLLQLITTYSNNHNSVRLLAYGLYADDINLKNNSDELMYLLDAQQNDGSWSVSKKFNKYNKDFSSTVYGLWALCEFRDKLLRDSN